MDHGRIFPCLQPNRHCGNTIIIISKCEQVRQPPAACLKQRDSAAISHHLPSHASLTSIIVQVAMGIILCRCAKNDSRISTATGVVFLSLMAFLQAKCKTDNVNTATNHLISIPRQKLTVLLLQHKISLILKQQNIYLNVCTRKHFIDRIGTNTQLPIITKYFLRKWIN